MEQNCVYEDYSQVQTVGTVYDCGFDYSAAQTSLSLNVSGTVQTVLALPDLQDVSKSKSSKSASPKKKPATARKRVLKGTKKKSIARGSVNPALSKNSLPAKETKKKKDKVNESSAAEESVEQVRDRFAAGCECNESCFKDINPEFVYKHRLNIAELTRSEHDMYLMGVTMASLSNPEETARHTERKRLRAQYVFQGKKVCLDAFLYLENCTQYQLKRIRKHIMTHGVTPRVHGNHGKRPHNTFSLDSYQHATAFLQSYIQQYATTSNGHKKTSMICLPPDVTRKKVHAAYREFMKTSEPAAKCIGYSTFRHFLKHQFPHVKFMEVNKVGIASSHAAAIDPANNQASTETIGIPVSFTTIPAVTIAFV